MIETGSLPDKRELQADIIENMIEKFGITKASFFLRETMSRKTDYLKIKDELFSGKSIEELYQESRKFNDPDV